MPGDAEAFEVVKEGLAPGQPRPSPSMSPSRWNTSEYFFWEAAVIRADDVSSKFKVVVCNSHAEARKVALSQHHFIGDVIKVPDLHYPSKAVLMEDVHLPGYSG